MTLVDKSITIPELQQMAKKMFGNLVKAVVDIEKKVMVIDSDLHADEEAYLLEHGSNQDNLWGINLYPDQQGDDFVEFDSMINLRPTKGNMARGVDDPVIRQQILEIVSLLVKK